MIRTLITRRPKVTGEDDPVWFHGIGTQRAEFHVSPSRKEPPLQGVRWLADNVLAFPDLVCKIKIKLLGSDLGATKMGCNAVHDPGLSQFSIDIDVLLPDCIPMVRMELEAI